MVSKVLVIARKEFTDTVSSRRFWIVVAVFLLVFLFNTVSVYLSFRAGQIPQERDLFLEIGRSIVASLEVAAPLLGIALGFSAISGERERGTLRLILSKPVYRDVVVSGKVLASLACIMLVVSGASLLAVIASAIQGVAVMPDHIVRLAIFIALATLYALTYYAFSLLASILSRKSSHSLLLSLAVWVFFAIALPAASIAIASLLAEPPPPTTTGLAEWLSRVIQTSLTLQYFSPNLHYASLGYQLFGIRITFTAKGNVVEVIEYIGKIDPVRLVVTQWADLALLALYSLMAILASYIAFVNRQEK